MAKQEIFIHFLNSNFTGELFIPYFCTVVGDFINIMKTTFEFNFNLYYVFKQHMDTQKHENREKLAIKKAYL